VRAVVFRERGGEAVLEDRPIPRPGSDQVLVRVEKLGIGVTNELARQGELGGTFPVIPGHELAGTIERAGSDVSGWRPGDRVTASFYLFCGRCIWCLSGREPLCERMAGYVGIATDGAAAEYVTLPARNLVAIPEGVSPAQAAIVSDAVATGYHVVHERLRVHTGQRIAVIGCGPLGLHVIQLAAAAGGEVVAIERDAKRLETTLAEGLAAAGVVASAPDWHADARAAVGGPLDGVVDTVGSSETLREGVRALGRRGTLAILGHTPGAVLEADPVQLLLEEQVVMGTRYATRAEIAKTLDLVARGRIRPVLGERFGLERFDEALRLARTGSFGRIVLEIAPS
jgi:D-arabinose 1-dehydrogenase-like Zn-dependent alcohol dehydrogenase